MSLNDIELPPQIIAALYTNTLVNTVQVTVAPDANPKYLGNNDKNILILVSNQTFPFLGESELQLLTTILSACGLSLADVALINLKNSNIPTLNLAMKKLGSKQVLMFGVEPLTMGLPINFPQFQLQNFNNQTFLHAPPISELLTDKQLKTKLWTSLKAIFNLN